MVVCDQAGCEVEEVSPAPGLRRKGAKDYCDEHYPYDRCEDCERRMRPFKARKEDWPGTVARNSSNPPLCVACKEIRDRGRRNIFYGIDTTAALTYIFKHNDGEGANRIIEALGLEAHVEAV